jgi:hypothetical protein
VDVDKSVIFCISWNPKDDITEWQILSALESVKPHLGLLGKERVAFCRTADATMPNQKTVQVAQQINALGFEILDVSDMWGKRKNISTDLGPLPPDQFFWAMHMGETWGYLKLYPQTAEELEPYDIPVFNVLPLDLGVVAGVITTVQQTVASHVNLKSNERNTPNMVLTNTTAYPCLTDFADKPVHLLVTDYGFLLEPTTPEIINAKQAEIFASKYWVPLYHETSEELMSYDHMCPDDPTICLEIRKKTYGTKASNLGFLAHKNVMGRVSDAGSFSANLGYDLTPYGFGIPFSYYYKFINYPPNAHIKQMIHDLSGGIMNETLDQFQQFDLANQIKVAIFNAKVPPELIQNIRAKLDEVFTPYGVNRFKFRSSSNAEDLPGFDGAGLYDSFSCKFKDTSSDTNDTCTYNPVEDDIEPSTVQCALKGVYGSLYNARAIQERTYARYVHDTCLMGISVVSKYGELGSVTGNAVAVTKLPSLSTHTGYSYSLQDADNDVTNPIIGTISETSLAIFNPNDNSFEWQVQRYAVPVPYGPVLTTPVVGKNLTDLATRALLFAEEQYCIYGFKLSAAECSKIRYNTAKRALDVEFKFMNNSFLHFKQIREFSGFKGDTLFINSSLAGPCSWTDESYFRGPNGESYENVAYKKPTKQHSTALGQNSSFAVDGIVEGFFSYTSRTNVGTGVWWEVDLQDSFSLAYVRVWGSNDPTQLKKFDVILTYEDGTNKTLSVNQTGSRFYLLGPLDTTVPKPVVRVRVIQKENLQLALAEVQVWAKKVVVGDPAQFVLPGRSPVTDCVWSEWTDWSECTAICNGGVQNRSRTDNGYCIKYSIDPYFESRDCNTDICCEVSGWSDWDDCDCNGQQKKIRIITQEGVACPALSEFQSCTKPDTCVTPIAPTPVAPTPEVSPVAPVPAPEPGGLQPTATTGDKLLTFELVGTGDPKVIASQVDNLLEQSTGITDGSLSVVVTPSGKDVYTVTVQYSGAKSNDVIDAVKDESFPSTVENTTGLSYVPGSLSVASDEAPAEGSSPIPYWVWIIVGVGCFIGIAIIIAAIIHFSAKRAEMV